MILQQYVEVTVIPRLMEYYRNLGYNVSYKQKIKVPISDLPKNSNKKVSAICDSCKTLFVRQLQLLNKSNSHYCYFCARKEIGKKFLANTWGFSGRNTSGENHPRWNPRTPEFKRYANKVHWLTQKVYKEFKEVINPHNYPRTRCGIDGGYQLDHIMSIKEGFDRGIPPEKLASLDNLQMLPWKINRTKHTKPISSVE